MKLAPQRGTRKAKTTISANICQVAPEQLTFPLRCVPKAAAQCRRADRVDHWPVEGNGEAGLRPARLATLVRRAIADVALDLSGATVLTEAATGPYVVTPVLAAAGGASSVSAVTRATRHGSVDEVVDQTMALAGLLGVADRITIHAGAPTRELVAAADVVTNSGHVRPLDARLIEWLRPDAVVPLMFESWELGLGRDDVDVEALRSRRIRFAGTNERHPAVDNFSYLGPMAVKLLHDANVAGYRSRLLLLCNNPFSDYLRSGLERVGADVVVRTSFVAADVSHELDAVVVALAPTGAPVLAEEDVAAIGERAPGAVLAQFWGDVPREWCAAHGVPCAPVSAPGAGHMGVIPSAIGPEPIVRLQAGGLKVAEVLRKPRDHWTDDDRSFVDEF